MRRSSTSRAAARDLSAVTRVSARGGWLAYNGLTGTDIIQVGKRIPELANAGAVAAPRRVSAPATACDYDYLSAISGGLNVRVPRRRDMTQQIYYI